MWILQNVDGSQVASSNRYYLIRGRSYVVGRKDCDIVLLGENTISRKHAVVSVNGDSQESEFVILRDTSKIGIHVNDKKLKTNEDVMLKENDVLYFGRYSIKFVLKNRKFNVVMSAISGTEKKAQMKNLINKLGGCILDEWSKKATHLLMEGLSFTIKVVCALATAKHIVTPKFFEDFIDVCDQKQTGYLPNEINYLPPIIEQCMENQEQRFSPDFTRSTLMDNKQLVVLHAKQYKRIRLAFEMAGGDVILRDKRDTSLTQQVSSRQTIVLQPEKRDESQATQECKQWMYEVYKKLKSCNLRPIRESEVGLAIFQASIQTHCNPSSKTAAAIEGGHTQLIHSTQQASQQSSQQYVISQQTVVVESQTQLLLQKEEKPPSLAASNKRKTVSEDIIKNSPANKKTRISSQLTTSAKENKKLQSNSKNTDQTNSRLGKNTDHASVYTSTQKDDLSFGTEPSEVFVASKTTTGVSKTKLKKDARDEEEFSAVVPESEGVDKGRSQAILATNTAAPFFNTMTITPHKPIIPDTYTTPASKRSSSGDTFVSPQNTSKSRVPDTFVSPQETSKNRVPDTFVSPQETSKNRVPDTFLSPQETSKSRVPDTFVSPQDTFKSRVTDTFKSPIDSSARKYPNTFASPLDSTAKKPVADSFTSFSSVSKKRTVSSVVDIDVDDDDIDPFDFTSKSSKNTESRNKRSKNTENLFDSPNRNLEKAQSRNLHTEKLFDSPEKNLPETEAYPPKNTVKLFDTAVDESGWTTIHKSQSTIKSQVTKSQTSRVDNYVEIADDDIKLEDISVAEESQQRQNSRAMTSRQAKSKRDVTISQLLPDTAVQETRPRVTTLKGFISCVNKKSSVVKTENFDPDLEDVPRDLIQTAFVSLVVKPANQNQCQPKSIPGLLNKPKNFKRFKKQFVVGKQTRKKLVGVKDFTVFESENSQRDILFNDFREEEDKDIQKAREINELFDNWGNDGRSVTGKKRKARK